LYFGERLILGKPMKLNELSHIVKIPIPYQEIGFSGITNDSRQVMPGDLYLAVPGYKTNGFLYLEEAIRRGAIAALTAGDSEGPVGFPVIPVDDIRKTQGLVASVVYGKPSRHLRVIGVTGTNGKTTVTHLIEHILASCHIPVGLIGTVWINNGVTIQKSKRTTPDSIELQKILADMVKNGITTVVMEVSSHALSQDRLAGIEFDAAVLTNITHDHFDFHHDYQSYLASKSLLFQSMKPGQKHHKYAVINLDDPSSGVIAGSCAVPVFFYGTSEPAAIRVKDIRRKGLESILNIDLNGEECRIETRLPGGFNIYNIMAAITVARQEGVSVEELEIAVPAFPGVPGRYQEIQCGQPFRVMVDFAHNPAALENILIMARENTKGRRIVVFGCEGEKDRLKRPLMGKIAVENAEIPILTSDNTYHEDLNQIFEDVLHDLPGKKRNSLIIEPNRKEAIEKAIDLAMPGDFLIVAGKGHEEYLINGSEEIIFNDAEVIKEILCSNCKPSELH
jgi:UDP-N-acetylmuramoyl-L-alanyl-D-glutamate--2,6-diaminopimelate ligase